MILRARKMNIGWLLVVVAMAAPAGAADRRRRFEPFKIVDVSGKLEISAEFFEEDRKNSSTGSTLTQTRKLFEETGELRTQGYFYHPKLVDWFVNLDFTLNQNIERINDEDVGSKGRILGYNIDALILQEKPISFRTFASSTSNILHREFAGSFDLETSNVGIEVFAKGPFPAVLRYEQIRSCEEDNLRKDDEKTGFLQFNIADRRNPDWFTEFTFERENVDETTTTSASGGGAATIQDQSFLRNEGRLSNNWMFGPEEGKHRLFGGARVLNREGFYTNEVFSVDQTLELVHSGTFETFYKGRLDNDKTDTSDERQIAGEIGFNKDFYESLFTTGRLYFSDRDFLDGTEDIRGAEIDLDYRKITPIGRFVSSLVLAREREKETSSTGLRNIRDESIVLAGIVPQQLSSPGVIGGTVVVTNVTKTITYIEGVAQDYTLSTVGVFTEITRNPGGTIANGQTVLVSYTIRAARDAEFLTDRVGWYNRMYLKHLPVSVYVSYDLDDRQLTSGDDPGNLETRKSVLAGVQLDHKGLTVIAEHERIDQKLSPPTIESRLYVHYHKQLRQNLDVTVGGRAERLTFLDADRFDLESGRDFRDSFNVFGRLVTKLSRRTLLRLDADYTRTRGQNNDSLAHIGVVFEWRYGKLDFSIEARHNVFEQESTSGTEDMVFIKLSRRF